MRLVDIREDENSRHKFYNRVDVINMQPMVIYHSREELVNNEDIMKAKIYARSNLVATLRQEHIERASTYDSPDDMNSEVFIINHLKKDHKIFLGTDEKVVPDVIDERGNVTYKLSEFKVIHTDGCYIQLLMSQNIRNSFVLVTSSGVWTASDKEVYMSAGVPPRLQPPSFWNKDIRKQKSEHNKTKRLYKYMHGKTEIIEDTKFVSYFLNPLSPTYLNVMGSAQSSYNLAGNVKLNARQIMEVVSTPRVYNIILRELGVFMPALAEAVKKKSTPDSVAIMLNNIAEMAIKNENTSVDDKLKSVQAIVNVGYPEELVNISNTSPQPALPGGAFTTPLIGSPVVPPEVPMYNDDDTEDDKDKPPKTEKKSFDQLKKEAGVIDEYMIEEEPRPKLK